MQCDLFVESPFSVANSRTTKKLGTSVNTSAVRSKPAALLEMTDYRGQAGTMVAVKEEASGMHETRRGSYTEKKKAGPGHLSPSRGVVSECTLLSREAAVLCLVHSRSFRNAHGYGSHAECGHYSAFLETPWPYLCFVPKPFRSHPRSFKKTKSAKVASVKNG